MRDQVHTSEKLNVLIILPNGSCIANFCAAERLHHACKMGLEGIVSKRLGSRYRSGRSSDWLKFKNPQAPAVDVRRRQSPRITKYQAPVEKDFLYRRCKQLTD